MEICKHVLIVYRKDLKLESQNKDINEITIVDIDEDLEGDKIPESLLASIIIFIDDNKDCKILVNAFTYT